MSSLQESPEQVEQTEVKSSTQGQTDKQPNLLDIEITDEELRLFDSEGNSVINK